MSSKRDREKLRSRIKAQLDEGGRSQRDLEAALGLSTGILTRVFSGKKAFDAELLASVAEGLDADPAELVEGTAWAALLGGAPAPTEEAVPAPAPTPTKPAATAKVSEPSAAKPEARREPPREEPARREAARAEPTRAEPPPSERPADRRARKRDLPGKALRFLSELIFG